MKYLQFFMWTSYEPGEFRNIIFSEQPDLIEWIATEEAAFYMRDEYRTLVDYKRSKPSASIKVLCGTMNFPEVDDNGIEFEGCPLFFIADLVQAYGEDSIMSFEPSTEIKYKLCSPINHGHYFRCQLIDYFEKYGLINPNNIITWQNKRVHEDYVFRWFDRRTITVDDLYEGQGLNYHKLMPNYHETFLDAFSESAIDSWFLTEKTVKPLLWLKPFISWTALGYHKFLQDLGFELFPELIDYSFDSEPDQELRCEMFVQQAARINSMSLTELNHWRKILMPKLLHNRQHTLGMLYNPQNHPKRVVEWKKYDDTDNDIVIMTSTTANRQAGWYHIAKKYNL